MLGTLFGWLYCGALTRCALLHSVCNLKPTQMNFCFTRSNWAIIPQKQTKTFIVRIKKPDSWRNFARVAGTLTISQDQVGLKLLIPRSCIQPLKQIRCVVLGEYQASSASHSSVRCIIFITLANVSGAAELCHTLPKYWKTWFVPVSIFVLTYIGWSICLSIYLSMTKMTLKSCSTEQVKCSMPKWQN